MNVFGLNTVLGFVPQLRDLPLVQDVAQHINCCATDSQLRLSAECLESFLDRVYANCALFTQPPSQEEQEQEQKTDNETGTGVDQLEQPARQEKEEEAMDDCVQLQHADPVADSRRSHKHNQQKVLKGWLAQLLYFTYITLHSTSIYLNLCFGRPCFTTAACRCFLLETTASFVTFMMM